jgi:hypothetical protein
LVERLWRLHSILFAADASLEHGDAAAALALVLHLLGFQALSVGASPDDTFFTAPIRVVASARARRHLTRPRPPTVDNEDGDLGVFTDLDGVMEKKVEGRGLEGRGGSSAIGDTGEVDGGGGGVAREVLAVAAPQ